GGTLAVCAAHPLPVRIVLPDWEREWSINRPGLPSYLARSLADLADAPTVDDWKRHLGQGEVLLLFDGLDELTGRGAFVDQLRSDLLAFARCPMLLTGRTMSSGQHRHLCPDFPVFTLAGLDDTRRDCFIRAFPAEYPERFDAAGLIRRFNQTPSLRPL